MVQYGCFVIGEAVSHQLPLVDFLEAGICDEPVEDAEAVLANVRARSDARLRAP